MTVNSDALTNYYVPLGWLAPFLGLLKILIIAYLLPLFVVYLLIISSAMMDGGLEFLEGFLMSGSYILSVVIVLS